MNPSNLPPQGRYADDHLQQMVLDQLGTTGIAPEKFYFTSDDWMITNEGTMPAWNSVFGIATYRKDGRPCYAECGVSQRYDPATSQWGEPVATVKVDLPLSEEAYAAAPSALSGGVQPGGASFGDSDGVGAPGPAGIPDSSQTVMAGSLPDVPGHGHDPGQGPRHEAADQESATTDVGGSAGADDGLAVDFPSGADDGLAAGVPSGEEWSAAERADGQPRVVPGPGHEWQHTEAEPEREREPVPSGDEWSSAEPATQTAAADEELESDLRQAGDLGVDESAFPDQQATGGQTADMAAGGAEAVDGMAPGGEADLGHGMQDSRGTTPSYEAAGAAAQAREHPNGDHHADVAGYALRVREDGTAELQVPLGGQVTLRWAGQPPQ